MSGEDRDLDGGPVRYLHLTPAEVWERQAGTGVYLPEAYEADGFVHFTIGEANLLAVANLFYRGDGRGDGREHVVLEIDPSALDAPVRFEDSERIYPHLHGPLNAGAVLAVRPVRRSPDGGFEEIDSVASNS